MADFLDDIIAPRESGRRPNIGWGNTDLTPWLQAGKTVFGFPDWPGKPGPEGNSTAAGLYQITKTNWKNLAPKLGVNDFSPESQRKVAEALLATQGPKAWAASAPGYKSGLPARGPREGYYDGALHVNIRPNEPEGVPLALLDQILGQHQESEGEKQKTPIALLDELLSQKPEAKPAAQAAPRDEFIEPPSPVPPAANVIDQGPLEPADIKPIGTATGGPKAEPAVARPKEPSALLDSLLNEPIEPMPKGATLPPMSAGEAGGKPPESMLDGLLRQAGTAVHAAAAAPAGIAQGAADIVQGLGGLAERARLGALNTMRLPGSEPLRATVPMEPGLQAAGGLADFATGGYVGHLAPPVASAAHPAAGVAQNVSRETSAAMPALMADEAGAIRLFHGAARPFPPEPGAPLGRFDPAKIGSGEGHHAEGLGAYASESRRTAEWYKKQYGEESGGALYEMEHPTADPDHFLRWDLPLRAQSSYVKERLSRLGLRADTPISDWDKTTIVAGDLDGQALYHYLGIKYAPPGAEPWSSPGGPSGDPFAANVLKLSGIRGVRYPAGGLSGREGKFNYSIFEPQALNIVRRLMADESGAVRIPRRAAARTGGGEPPREPPPSARFPLLDPPIPGEGLKQTATRVDDALHRVMTNGTADKIEVKRWWQGLPRIYKDPKTRAMMADDIERRMIDPKAELNPVTQSFIDGPGKTLIANENRIANWLRRELGNDAKYADLPSAPEGYVHRVVESPPGRHREEVLGRLDPEKARVSDVVTGAMPGRGRSLSKFAASMQHRAPRFVLEDEAGNRVFQKHETLGQKGYEYGQAIETPDGQKWTVKQPTMAEMEANTPVRYVHDYVGNLVGNVLRLRRIKRNVELLRDLKSEMEPKGLFYPEQTKAAVPEHFKTVDLPQLKGYADPKIANVLNDFWNPGDDLSKALSSVNRFLIGTLFVTPVPHINNVATHWIIGRGWDWMSAPAYIRGAKAGAKALNAVWNLTPEYTRMLREGSGLLYGDVAMENFYNQLIQKTWIEQARNPEVWTAYAKSLGLKGLADLIKAEYRWSRKTLWAVNDMLMLQRQFELEARGKPTRQAIFEAEKDIPNYRVPSEVMGSRLLSMGLKSPNFMNFGRYHYGLMRSLSEMVKDMIGPKATLAERTEAAGKLTVLGMIGILGFPALDALLRQVTGNEDATARRAGPLSVLSAGGTLARNAYQKFSGESADLRNPFGQQLLPGDKEWVSITAPLMTPAPTMAMIPEVVWGRDWMGREIVDPRASPMGMAVQTGEAVASHISPLQMLMQSAQEGGATQAAGGLVGLSLPRKPPGPSGRTEKMLRGRARSRERKDPVQNLIESVVGP